MLQRTIWWLGHKAGGTGALRTAAAAEARGHSRNFLFFDPHQSICYSRAMTFQSLPYEPRKLEATEARLEAIYSAAKMGLKGEALALAAGMLPVEYRQLTQFDPIAAFAEQKGRADGEMEMAQTLYTAAREGDANAALNMLRYSHDWAAKQAIEVTVEQRISITAALEEAQRRVIDIVATEVTHGEKTETRV